MVASVATFSPPFDPLALRPRCTRSRTAFSLSKPPPARRGTLAAGHTERPSSGGLPWSLLAAPADLRVLWRSPVAVGQQQGAGAGKRLNRGQAQGAPGRLHAIGSHWPVCRLSRQEQSRAGSSRRSAVGLASDHRSVSGSCNAAPQRQTHKGGIRPAASAKAYFADQPAHHGGQGTKVLSN